MLYPSLSDMLKHVSSRYMLVNVIAHRARQIAAEHEKNGEPLKKKPVSMAIEEIATGRFRPENID
jgi:DNA-directed RNA polymerase subunit omega